MAGQPTLRTKRLLLRPFSIGDAAEVRRLAGAREIADTTLAIPHPYPEGAAEAWIATHAISHAEGDSAVFAIVRAEDSALLGSIGLQIDGAHRRAELGYWVGKPYWNQGFASEAAAAVLRCGFDLLGLERIHAHCLTRNPASGRVLRKIGMTPEGRLRAHVLKWEVREDIEVYGILKGEPVLDG